MFNILVINPGSTSTKIALYQGNNEVWKHKINYDSDSLMEFSSVLDQKQLREEDIKAALYGAGYSISDVHAIAARGGPYKPLSGGTYRINATLIDDIYSQNVQAEHISNVAALIARDISEQENIPAFFVDPVSVDEMNPLARYSGLPEIPRRSLVHALNIKESARQYASSVSRKLDTLNLIVAHLGGGISIVPLEKGRIVDVNNANEEGPFSPERAGTLPASSLMKLCMSGKYCEKELKKKIVGTAGITAYLGTNDLKEVERRISEDDQKAKEVLSAMAYQIAKEIGAMSTVLRGKIDQIIFTGGASACDLLIQDISKRISFLSGITVYAGEFEMLALANGVLRILNKQEEALEYE